MLATTIAAYGALVLAVVSLAWQVVSWRRSGPQIKVWSDTGVTFGPLGTFEFRFVTVHNSGRADAWVQSMGFVLPNGKRLVGTDSFIKRVTLPEKVEGGGAEIDFWYDPAELRAQCEKNQCELSDLVPFARVAGRTVTGKWVKRSHD